MQEAPDEFAHYWVIKFIHEHWRLPNAGDITAAGPSAVYGSLPQLGYVPHLFTSAFFSSEVLALSSRFGSLIAGLVLLYAAYEIGLRLFPNRLLFSISLPLALCLHPQLIFLHAYANNDSTSSALAGVIILLMIECIAKGNSFNKTAAMGALSGWLVLSKYAGLAILPGAGFAYIAALHLHGTSLLSQLPSLLFAAFLAAAPIFLLFVRNAHEFAGDFMGTKTMYANWATTFHRDLHYYLSPWKIVKDFRWWRMTFFSFWGLFGYMNKYLWRPIYFFYIASVLVALSGWLQGLARLPKEKPDPKSACIWLSLTLILLLNLTSMVWASIYNLGGPQGRYLFTSEIPITALIIGGLSRFKQPADKWFLLAFLGLNAAVALHAWIFLFQSYGGFKLSPL